MSQVKTSQHDYSSFRELCMPTNTGSCIIAELTSVLGNKTRDMESVGVHCFDRKHQFKNQVSVVLLFCVLHYCLITIPTVRLRYRSSSASRFLSLCRLISSHRFSVTPSRVCAVKHYQMLYRKALSMSDRCSVLYVLCRVKKQLVYLTLVSLSISPQICHHGERMHNGCQIFPLPLQPPVLRK